MRYENRIWLCALVFVMCLPCVAQFQCSQEMIRGTWVDSMQGVLLTTAGSSQTVAAPTAGLVIFKIDWQGRFAAKGTESIGGEIANGEVDGTFQVNPDCTATATFTMTPEGAPGPLPGQGTERLLILDNGKTMRSMPTQSPMGPAIQIETLRRISVEDPVCTNDTVRGAYGTTYQGWVMMTIPGQKQPTPVPVSYIGAGAVDYQGRMSGSGTFSQGGQILEVTFPNSTMQINQDCTGTMTWNLQPEGMNQPLPGQGMDKVVAVDNGDEIILLTVQGVQGNPVMLGSMKRLSMTPVAPAW